MPNWIHNRLTVTGEPEALADFVTGAEDDEVDERTGEAVPLDFEQHVPTPAELLTNPLGRPGSPALSPDSDDGWCFWRNENWGTKWNAQWPERSGAPADGRVAESSTSSVPRGGRPWIGS